MKLFPSIRPSHSVSLFPLTSWIHLSTLLIFFTRSLSLLQHLVFIISSADFSSAITLCQMTSCIYQSILYYSNILDSSILCHFIALYFSLSLSVSLSRSLAQIHNKCLTKLFQTILFSAVCEPASSDMYV